MPNKQIYILQIPGKKDKNKHTSLDIQIPIR